MFAPLYKQYDELVAKIKRAKSDVARLLDEEPDVAKPRSPRENLRQMQKEVQQLDQSRKQITRDLER